MRRYRSRLGRWMLELRTFAAESLSWAVLPTLTVAPRDNKGGAAGRAGKDRPCLSTMARRGILPTLLASTGAKGGPNSRHFGGGQQLPAVVARLMPTLMVSDGSGKGGYKNPPPGGVRTGGDGRTHSLSLQDLTPGPLNPEWCEWFMGFPVGWTESGL